MTDTAALKSAILESGITVTAIAKHLGCTRNRVYALADGTGGEATASEIKGLTECLHLTGEERDKIFFAA